MYTFSEQDIAQISERGSNPENVIRQFSFFESGFPFASLARPAVNGDGIIHISEPESEELIQQFPGLIGEKTLVKFVPASGAATRMFKELYSYLERDDEDTRKKALEFLSRIPHYAFYEDLEKVMAEKGVSLREKMEQGDYRTVIRYILFNEGLNYGSLPKGLIRFHRYDTESRYAVEEHLVEAALYAKDFRNQCRLHLTVSPQHKEIFRETVGNVKGKYEERFGVNYSIEFSVQDPATDTLAATCENRPFRDESGNLLFRPGGHGALLRNLEAIYADLVFIKNIDNVYLEKTLPLTVKYKKVLASLLLKVKNKVDHHLSVLEKENNPDVRHELIELGNSYFALSLNNDTSTDQLINIFNRPFRVCGMVKNEGQPGGGPFWVKSRDGQVRLQIVESSQIDANDVSQRAIMERSTHFNPVDMVCSLRNFKGEYFPLEDFVDEKTGFISEKTYGDNHIKAMELPGLWNGAMSDWLTLFVEVPIDTFHPVKTVFDLADRVN